MKVTKVLRTAILLLLPAAIVPAYAQEHEQEKQPEQKKQQPAKPAQHQQEAKPSKAPQQAQHQQQAKPEQHQQQAKHLQQAKPAQQPQRASRGAQPAAGHGSIPEAKFRSSFGSGHRFHVNRSQFANGSGRFQYGGYWFNTVDPWPVGWLYTDDVYVDYLNGGYFLCDPIHPGVFISINIG